jgi:hypothetical protein
MSGMLTVEDNRGMVKRIAWHEIGFTDAALFREVSKVVAIQRLDTKHVVSYIFWR